MFYRVLYPFTFDNVTYKTGDVIDFGDPELANRLIHEAGSYAVELTTAEVLAGEVARKTAKAEAKAAKAEAKAAAAEADAKAAAREVKAQAKVEADKAKIEANKSDEPFGRYHWDTPDKS